MSERRNGGCSRSHPKVGGDPQCVFGTFPQAKILTLGSDPDSGGGGRGANYIYAIVQFILRAQELKYSSLSKNQTINIFNNNIQKIFTCSLDFRCNTCTYILFSVFVCNCAGFDAMGGGWGKSPPSSRYPPHMNISPPPI